MNPLPPPIALWAPRLRRWLTRFLSYMDRRTARRLADSHQTYLDHAWRTAYTEWWNDHGWLEGAPTPEQAWQWLHTHRHHPGYRSTA